MSRPRKAAQPPTGMIASAVRLPASAPGRPVSAQPWQGQAWHYYNTVGELRFVANWVGNVMSRAGLVAFHVEQTVSTPLTEGPAVDALEAYFGGLVGQAEMLRQTGVHLTIAGECFHVYRAKDETWWVLAAGAVAESGGVVRIDFGEGQGKEPVSEGNDLVIRVWTPHPTQPWMPDSPTRSNLAPLAEIERCDLHVQATLTSRLAGNGILFLPDNITFPVPDGMDPSSSTADVFMRVLGEAMMTPIAQPGQPSSQVPVVVTAPAEALDAIKHMTFFTQVDAEVREMRDNAVKRLSLGMDIPPEVLTGLADTNHWNAWLVDEASVKAHTEPRLAIVVNAITTSYLRPAIDALVPDPEAFGVAADTANLRLRPNRSKEAIELWDRGELGGEALRRETGFDPADAPDSRQFQEWLLRKIALGSTSPEQTQAALTALGADLPRVIPIAPAEQNSPFPDDLAPRRSLEEHPTRDLPEEPMIAAADVLVWRALERAGNRLRSATSYSRAVPAAMVYLDVQARADRLDMLLGDAWACTPDVLAGRCPDVGAVTAALDGYVRHLLITQTPHTPARMLAALRGQQVAIG